MMQKDLSSRVGVFNRRVVVSFALCAMGMAMALLSFAATPSSGTLSPANPTLTFAGGPFAVPNPTRAVSLQCANPALPCDNYALTVNLPPDYRVSNPNATITITLNFPPSADYDLYLIKSGAVIGSSAGSSTTETVTVTAGSDSQLYNVRVVPFNAIGGETYSATIQLNEGVPPPVPDWSIVSSPNATGAQTNNILNGTTCVSDSDCWAVGYYHTGSNYQTLIQHWNGISWTTVDSPNIDPFKHNYLDAVTCTSASDCWAVGSSRPGNFYQTLIMHWDGASWSIVPSPNYTSNAPNNLFAVTCSSATDCWAVGAYNVNGVEQVTQTLIVRWDGTSWSLVPSANTSATEHNLLYGVSCVSGSDCWAVGYYDTGTTYKTLIQRWNGAAWNIVASPNTSATQFNFLSAVTCVSGSDCWAVGFYQGGGVDQTLVLRWNGTSWNIVTSPSNGSSQLTSVTCASGSDCRAVGTRSNGTNRQTLIERWNGTSWAIVASPSTSPTQNNYLTGVTCASGSDCWAVGHYVVGFTYQTIIERWNGTAWTIAASPNNTGTKTSNLRDVACASDSDCWAVGNYQDGQAWQPLIEHWNGTAWSIVTSPSVSGAQFHSLSGVTCPSASNCWAVGQFYNGSAEQTLVLRWNGTSWGIVASPNSSSVQNNYLTDITCTSASNCWAVGRYDTGATTQTLIQRWNGSTWTIVSSPNTSATQYNQLSGVTCASASNCWAVGYFKSGNTQQTLIQHWNGTSWTIVASPNTGTAQNNSFSGVTCASPTDCWAVGSDRGSITQTLIQHWDGTLWAIVPSPNADGDNYNVLSAVTCASPTNCWAVGTFQSGVSQTLVQRWDGASWAIAGSSNVRTQNNYLSGVTCSSATDCWAVGSHSFAAIYQTLIERYTPGPP